MPLITNFNVPTKIRHYEKWEKRGQDRDNEEQEAEIMN